MARITITIYVAYNQNKSLNYPFYDFQAMFDFTVLFPNVDQQALMKAWVSIKKKPLELFQAKLDERDEIFHCDVELHNFFGFLKLFQPHKVKLITAAKSFMVFSKVKCVSVCS